MISFDEAISIIGAAGRPLGRETVSLDDAPGRVLAAPVIAAIDSPRADVSAMDGYAVRDVDLADFPAGLKIVGESFPGGAWSRPIEPGTCVRIFTGASVPDGADRIVIQENVGRDGDRAIIEIAPGAATYVRARASDFSAGDELLRAGRLLDPAALVAAAGADLDAVEVYARPRLAILGTGDELVEPGRARDTALAVPESVSLGVAALTARWGAHVVSRARLPDDLANMTAAAREAADLADVVVVTGGASVGERDFAKAMFEPLGLDLLFPKVSIRPGKPAWLGRVGEKLVLGLPGNPTSALVTARLLLAPLLARLTGRAADEALRWEPARLAAPLQPCDARETFHRAQLDGGSVTPLTFQESHAQKALADADVLIRQTAHAPALAAGATVPVLRM